MKMTKKDFLTQIAIIGITWILLGTGPGKAFSFTAPTHEYGDVVMGKASMEIGLPVIFRHWTHRDKYTCRLCHVDLEFS